MNRSLTILGLAVALTGCRPAAGGRQPVETPGRDAVPSTYDWHFVAHGGSADLDFGDGDWAEGVSLFHLGCLPDSRRVRASWDGDGEAVLTSGTATGTFHRDTDTAADHPVFTALRDGGTLAVGLDDKDLILTARDPGRAQITGFFAYCTTPLPPQPQPAEDQPPALVEVAPVSEGDDQTDDLPGVEPVEPGVDIVEGQGAAHESVHR